MCGGALILPNVVLSAAHCPEPTSLIVGNTKSDSLDLGGVLVPKGCLIHEVHPGYDDSTAANDFSLCLLSLSVDISKANVKVDLNSGDDFLADGDMLRTIGMGALADYGSLPEILQWVDVPYIDHDTCNAEDAYDGEIEEDIMICAGFMEGGKDSCQGEFSNPTKNSEMVVWIHKVDLLVHCIHYFCLLLNR